MCSWRVGLSQLYEAEKKMQSQVVIVRMLCRQYYQGCRICRQSCKTCTYRTLAEPLQNIPKLSGLVWLHQLCLSATLLQSSVAADNTASGIYVQPIGVSAFPFEPALNHDDIRFQLRVGVQDFAFARLDGARCNVSNCREHWTNYANLILFLPRRFANYF